ncbi:MAG: hypothetical protein ACC641_01815 [Acidiferrobacterales bacterium]
MDRKRRPVENNNHASSHQRSLIATETARILACEGTNDYQLAKQKAADRLSVHSRRNLPSNSEIEQTLREYLNVFQSAALSERITTRRRVALKAMNFLVSFQPNLVGAVLRGTVTESSEIQLHLCADTPEHVAAKLMDFDIPYEIICRRIRFGGNRREEMAGYRFTAEGVSIELLVFSPSRFHEKPLSPIDGKTMGRASAGEVEALLGTGVT